MSADEVVQVMTYAIENMMTMDLLDQMVIMAAMNDAAERMKPVVTKHVATSGQPSTFLCKM